MAISSRIRYSGSPASRSRWISDADRLWPNGEGPLPGPPLGLRKRREACGRRRMADCERFRRRDLLNSFTALGSQRACRHARSRSRSRLALAATGSVRPHAPSAGPAQRTRPQPVPVQAHIHIPAPPGRPRGARHRSFRGRSLASGCTCQGASAHECTPSTTTTRSHTRDALVHAQPLPAVLVVLIT